MADEALTTGEAAKALGLAKSTVVNYARHGDLKGASKVNGRWRIPTAAVASFRTRRARTRAPGTVNGKFTLADRRVPPEVLAANRRRVADLIGRCQAGEVRPIYLDRDGNRIRGPQRAS